MVANTTDRPHFLHLLARMMEYYLKMIKHYDKWTSSAKAKKFNELESEVDRLKMKSKKLKNENQEKKHLQKKLDQTHQQLTSLQKKYAAIKNELAQVQGYLVSIQV